MPEIAKSFAEGLDKYFSSPGEKTYNFIRVRGFNPNEIKLNGKENLVDQLEKEGVDLKFIEDKIKKCARYLDKDRPHFVLMVLPDGRFFNIDINQYDRDKQQNLNEGPPSGPQKRSREQPDDEGPRRGILREPTETGKFFAEIHQKNSFEKNTPHAIPNLLPELLTKSETAIKASNKQPAAEGPPLGPQESNQKQHVAEGPPSGPQNTGDILKNASPPERPYTPTNFINS